MPKGQAEQLFPLLETLLKDAGIGWSDLDAIGVGTGPGNFTGIRISVSAARGLALSLDCDAIGINHFDILGLDASAPVLACVPAPREHVYVQGINSFADIAPQLIRIADIPNTWVEDGMLCAGRDAAIVAGHLGVDVHPASITPGLAIARLARARMYRPDEPPAPLYLKPADAAPSKEHGPTILCDDA